MGGPSTPLNRALLVRWLLDGALHIPHKGRTFGYRVSDGSAKLAYLLDHSPISFGPGPDGTGVYHDAAIPLS
jgi:hypothetical protein